MRHARVAKIAVSLPRALLDEIEKMRRATGLSRSAVVRMALEESMSRQHRAALVERYVQGYRRCPETAAEVAVAQSASSDVFKEPWE